MSGYPNQLNYYMWGYQVHFRISCQTHAESIFNHFDRSLSPKVFLLGFPKDDPTNFEKICYEEESLDYFAPIFQELAKKISENEIKDPDKNMFYSGPGMQEQMKVRISENWIRNAISDSLNESEEGNKTIYFVAQRILVENHFVYTILTLKREIYESHTFLTIGTFADRYKIKRSILKAAVANLLNDCVIDLQLPAPGADLMSRTRSAEELIKKSASDFMVTVASKGKNGRGLHTLFKSCNKTSIHRYEGKENVGKIFITYRKNQDIDYTLELEEPFLLSDYRKTRKLLQLTGGSIGLISDSYEVLGLGKIKDSYNIASESIFTIKFNGVHCWEVWHSNQTILIMRYGDPYLPHEVIGKARFFSDSKRLFRNISDLQIKNLYKLAVASTMQKNGALLIISGNAAEEAKRLQKQCIIVKPNLLDEERLLSMSSIDGGILIDIYGNAYAQGVILDGIVGNNGDSARGSRYNSAITYYDFKGKEIPTIIIVVSEDGMIDIIPFLRPQIGRSEIPDMILLLRQALEENESENYYQLMSWLKSKEFYLSKNQCNEINEIKKEMDSRDFESVRILHEDLFPNSEMNESYFL